MGFSDRARRIKWRRNSARPAIERLEPRVVLSLFRVNSLLDTTVVNLRTGRDASGHISLRSAIEAANARPNADTILLPAGVVRLTLAGEGEDNAATGDLDIRGNLAIKGRGTRTTIIDGDNLDRAIQIFAGKVAISKLSIEHGQASSDGGGGILNAGGAVSLTNVSVDNNLAIAIDGTSGQASPDGVTAGGQGGAGGDGGLARGGGILNEAGTIRLKNSVVALNRALGGRGGDGGDGGRADGDASSSGAAAGGFGGTSGVGGGASGGGIFNAAGAILAMTKSVLRNNLAIGGAGGTGGTGGFAGGANGAGAKPGGGAAGGHGGDAGDGGIAQGGGLFNGGQVFLTGARNAFISNQAVGGRGGNAGGGGLAQGGKGATATGTGAGGNGGQGVGGAGGDGGTGGASLGGGVVIDTSATIAGTSISLLGNLAQAGDGGEGGGGRNGAGGAGGGSEQGDAGRGGNGATGAAGRGGDGGDASGGGLHDAVEATLQLTVTGNSRAHQVSIVSENQAKGGRGGAGGTGSLLQTIGGAGGTSSGTGNGGNGGSVMANSGGDGGRGGPATGGGLSDQGVLSVTGTTMLFQQDSVTGGAGGTGGNAGNARAGAGGNGASGGDGGAPQGGEAGDGGSGGSCIDGRRGQFSSRAIWILRPRLGIKRSKGVDMITGKFGRRSRAAAIGGFAGSGIAGSGGSARRAQTWFAVRGTNGSAAARWDLRGAAELACLLGTRRRSRKYAGLGQLCRNRRS